MRTYYFIILLFICSNNYAQIVNIPDANFKDALVNQNVVDLNLDFIGDVDADSNDDGEIQLSEAQFVRSLIIRDKGIASLEGIQSFSTLEILWCDENQLTNLDVSQNFNLEFLWCFTNQLTSLDVSNNINLDFLWCSMNQITSLDLSNNPGLKSLFCYINSISSITIVDNPNLERIECWGNQLTSLDLKNDNNTTLTRMWAYNNPDLTCIQVDDVNYSNNAPDWDIGPNAFYSKDCLLSTEDFTSIDLTLFPNPAKDVLNIKTEWEIEKVEIYSLDGRFIKQISASSIDVSELTAGIYFVQMSVDGNRITKTFIKN